MMKAAEMRKVRIFALRSALPELIAALHKAGLVEIKKGEFQGMEDGRPLEFFSVVSEQLVRMRAMNAMLEKNAASKDASKREMIPTDEAVRIARELRIEEKLKALVSEAGAKESEMSRLRSQMVTIDKILPFTGVDFSRLETRTVAYRVGDIAPEKLHMLKPVLDKELGVYNVSQPVGSKTALVLYQKTGKSVDQVLAGGGFAPIEIPPGTTTPAQSRRALEKAYSEAESRLKEIRAELADMAKEYLPRVRDLIYSLGIEADRAEIASRFGFSKSMSVFEGWVMAKDVPTLSGVVAAFGDKASMSDVGFGHEEDPPVVLQNPKPAGPFEWVTKNYSLPNYYELDPSILYMIFIPILLGMIVGDFVYGVIAIFIALWLQRKFATSQTMQAVTKIWFYTGFTSMFFGLIFDEWCGFHNKELFALLHEWGLPQIGPAEGFYTGLSRLNQLPLLLGITIIVGLVHLGIGFMLGAINEWHHSKKHAAAKIAWIGVEVGGTFAIASLVLNLMPSVYGMVGLGIFLVSTIALALTEGVIGVIEIPGLMGNVLSYMRIAVIGVVGVVIAEIINEFFAPKPSMGIFVIVAIPIFIAFHLANSFIAIFEALIQGGRLNVIEFRMKFLKGGGKEFVPFALRSEAKQ
jgi:V/A-type H+-transporting ATPase subunit I